MNDFNFLLRETKLTFPVICEIAGQETLSQIIFSVINGDVSEAEKIVKTGVTGQNVVPFLILQARIFFEGLSMLKQKEIDSDVFTDSLCKKFKLKKRDPSVQVMLRGFYKECLLFLNNDAG